MHSQAENYKVSEIKSEISEIIGKRDNVDTSGLKSYKQEGRIQLTEEKDLKPGDFTKLSKFSIPEEIHSNFLRNLHWFRTYEG